MTDRMQQRRGTAADWATADPVLAPGEIGWATDTAELKIGDGSTAWSSLDALGGTGGGGGGGVGDPVDDPAEWGTDLGYDQEWDSGSAVPTGWAWVNQGTATATRTFGRCLIEEPTAASGNQLRIIERAIPSESTFEATVKMRGRIWPAASSYGHFLTLRDSVSGKVVTWGMHGAGSSTWGITRFDYSAAWSPTVNLSTTTDAALAPKFWQIRKNSATSWDFLLSLDGVVWDTFQAAHNVQTFLGTAPTHIGFGLMRNNQVTAMAVDWFRVR
jgi:hypothetical protein